MFKIQNFIIFSFTMLNTLKVYHWNTKIYSRHKSTDELITKLQILIDSFVESYLGKTPSIISTLQLDINNTTDNNITDEIKKYIKYINNIYIDLKSNTQLTNILDEILNNLNTSLYLFNLK